MTEHSHDHSHDLNVKKIDRLSPTKVRLTMEFSGESVTNHEKMMTNRYANQARLPGFRPGKAPLSMIKSKFKEEIKRDVMSHLLEAGLVEALQKTKLMPINRPKVQMGEFGEGKAFEFHAEFEVEPEIELKKYKGVPLKKETPEISEKEVEEAIEGLRDRLASLEPLEAKKAEKGSFAQVEVTFSLKDGSKKDAPQAFTVEVGVEKLLPNIDNALLEMEVGETRTVEEKFPTDHPDKVLAGKEALYEVKLLELKKKVLPEVDDAFAAQIKEGATVDQLKSEIRDSLKKGKQQDFERNQRQEIVDFLMKNNQFEVPTSMIEDQFKQLLQWMEGDMKRAGRSISELNKDELESIRKRAENMVRSSLLLKEVAIREKIELDAQRLSAKTDAIAASMNRPVEETKKYLEGKGMLSRLQDEVLTDQVFEFLTTHAEIK